jgi:hypothetical protein
MGVTLMTFACLFYIVKIAKRKENAMSTTRDTYPKVIASRHALMIGAIAFVSAALTAVYIWIMTTQTIASPGLRILDFLWRAFSWLRV